MATSPTSGLSQLTLTTRSPTLIFGAIESDKTALRLISPKIESKAGTAKLTATNSDSQLFARDLSFNY